MNAIILTVEQYLEIKKALEEIKARLPNKENELVGEWLNNKQVKTMLGISTRTLQNYRDTGVLQFSQHGRKIYYKRSIIEKYLNDHHIKF